MSELSVCDARMRTGVDGGRSVPVSTPHGSQGTQAYQGDDVVSGGLPRTRRATLRGSSLPPPLRGGRESDGEAFARVCLCVSVCVRARVRMCTGAQGPSNLTRISHDLGARLGSVAVCCCCAAAQPQPAPFPSVAARSRRGRPGTKASARPLLVVTPARQRSRRLTRCAC
jgi:hypothetical protein